MSRGHPGHIVSSRLAWEQRYRVRSCLKNRTKQNITCRFLRALLLLVMELGYSSLPFSYPFLPSFLPFLPLSLFPSYFDF